MKLRLVIVGLVTVAALGGGCDAPQTTGPQQPRQPTAIDVADVTELEPGTPRFKVQSHGKFRAGFDNNVREILLITDLDTGKTYLGITGVGISELRSESHTTTSVVPDGQGGLDVRTETTTETKER